MNQFGQTDGGESSLLVSGGLNDSFNQLFGRIAPALGSDHDAGVEDQSHVGGSRGSRWLAIPASTSLAKSSSRVATGPCSRGRLGDSGNQTTGGPPGCTPGPS